MKFRKIFCAVVMLVLFCGENQSALAQLRIDFNDRSGDLPVYTQESFDAFVIGAIGGSGVNQVGTNTLRYGTITVSVWNDLGIGLDDRRRTAPSNTATFTNAQILQDFIFNENATATNSGLSLRVQGLVSNQVYQFVLWSFDSGSLGNRVSDWYANGVLVRDNYSFNGAVLPTSNSDNRFSFSATADLNGEILIQGRRDSTSVDGNGAAATGVFLNALEIASIPDQSPPCGTIEHFKPGSNLYGWTGGANFAEQDQEVANLKEAGVQWARMNVVWYAVEPTQKGSYDLGLLSLYDHLMQKLGEAGIKVIFVTADTPYWASADPAKTNGIWSQKYKPTNNSNLADYFVFLLNRYRSTGPHAFEIWNEQNATFFWPSGVDATDYFNMLQTCYNAIKAADPQAIVLNGGLTDGSNTTNYMTSLYAAGGKNYFDAWSQHTYTKTPPYETVVSKVRDIMVANGDSAKKIWMTECGWLTATNGDSGAVSFNRQAHYLTNLFTRLATYPYVEVACWYTSRSYDENQHEGSFGLMLPDFTHKPSFFAYKDWVVAASKHCFPYFINLTPPTFPSNGVARFQFTADSGFNYTVQSSSNLTQWLNL
ncbi:MAG: beta-galactosidase, partial [Verrucomicrobiota bacterium]